MIERIYIRPSSDAPQTEHEQVHVVAGKGIEGDRYFARRDEPGQNVTFVEAEEIEAFQDAIGRPRDLSVTHRNVVTRGVRLAELVGKEFSIGGVRFRGMELCEPCRGLGKRLESPDLSAAEVVKRLVHRAGIRADALSSGVLARGAGVTASSA